MEYGVISNEKLGNFGFLLDYHQLFLFELGQQAESYLYTNLRLSAMYIRQLTEAFFDTVIDDFSITPIASAWDGSQRVPTIVNKQVAICDFFRKEKYTDSYYRDHVFPTFPGIPGDARTRVRCPRGEGDNSYDDKTLVDPSRETIFIWDAIRRIGNAGSHAVLSTSNQLWLEASYVEMAVKELCVRMGHYFYKTHNPNHRYQLHSYQPDHTCYGTRQILYGLERARHYGKNGILPAYREHLCVSVAPEPTFPERTGGDRQFQNRRNRFALVRSYERTEDTTDKALDRFLIQSQRVYLRMQQHGGIAGLPDFSVLADLRAEQGRYVSAYMFDAEPKRLDYGLLKDLGFYRDISKLARLFCGILTPLEWMCGLGIFHRTFTHQSVRLLEQPNGAVIPYIIDFETCKIFGETAQGTVYYYAVAQGFAAEDGKYHPQQEELQQYNGPVWNEETSQEEYRKEVLRRMAGVFLNILCPEHIENGGAFSHTATREEIFNGNWIDDELHDEPFRRGVETLTDVFTRAERGELDFPSVRENLEELQ